VGYFQLHSQKKGPKAVTGTVPIQKGFYMYNLCANMYTFGINICF